MKPYLRQIRITLWVIVAFSWLSCSDRERGNPLDPRNPDTAGRPTGLRAYSMERTVHLSWNPLNLADLLTMHIYRRATAGSFTRYASTNGSTFTDRAVEYGVRYEYYITAQSSQYESAPSTTVSSTPGPTFTWVADYQTGYVTCLSHDLGSVVGSYGLLFYPQVVACSPRERAAWAAARFEGQLYKVSQTGQLLATAANMDMISDLAVDTTTQDVWVAQTNPGRLTRLDHYGITRTRTTQVIEPVALAVSDHGTACWVLDGGDRHLKCFNAAGERIVNNEDPLLAPRDLVLARTAGKIWVADSSSIIQFDYSGRPTGLVVGPFFDVDRLVYNEKEHCLWAIDVEQLGVPSKLYKIDETGFIIFINESFLYPRGLAVDEFDGSCLVGDTAYDHYGLYRVDSDGSRVEAIDSFYTPVSIDIEYH